MLYDEIVSRTPVSGGWTPDRKYRAETADGSRYFLRIGSPERVERLRRAFSMQSAAAELSAAVARPLECGPCPEGFYTLEQWLDGADARDVIPNSTEPKLYADGLEAGRILQALHSIPAPAGLPDWAERYSAKLDLRIAQYRECPQKYERDEPFLSFIAENRGLLQGRPQRFQHGDFHAGNFMYTGGRLRVIDFDRCSFGDPWEDLKKIPWCVKASPALARGLVDGYFDGRIPAEFWRLLELYLCCGMLANLPWAIPYGEDEVQVMRHQAEQVLRWYDDMQKTVPGWYTEAGNGD